MFGTSGIRGPVGETVTADLALSLGYALGVDTDRVVVGRDPRASGQYLTDALTAGLRESGTDVIRLGVAATPTVARSVAWQNADTGVSVTASHNPPPDNGFKVWQPSGQAIDAQRRETITDRIETNHIQLESWDTLGTTSRWREAARRHQDAILENYEDADLSVIVDLGNGAGTITIDVLSAMGCAVETLNAQPDGAFPGRPSEPTADHCTSLRRLVANTDADIGIAHDGDADRMLAVADDGTWISGDVLLGIFAQATASHGDTIAAPVNTSLAIDDTLAKQDIAVSRTRVGDGFVADRTTTPGVVFGGEPSGAWIWPDQTLCPDGPLAAATLVSLLDKADTTLSALADSFPAYPIQRASFETADKHAVMTQITERVTSTYDDVNTLDGVRVDLDDAWFLIRASGTQPLVRVTAEARTDARTADVFDTARQLVTTAIDPA